MLSTGTRGSSRLPSRPLEDIDLVADPHDNFDLIMTDGVIFKNEIG
jgi:hypothetical protein